MTLDADCVVALDKGTYLESEGTGRLHDVVRAPGVRVIDLLVDVQLDHEARAGTELCAGGCDQVDKDADVYTEVGAAVDIQVDQEVGDEVEVGAAEDTQVDHEACPGAEL